MPLSPQCPTCKHYQLNEQCDAFAEGIPDEIFLGWFDHREPWPDDNGIRWEPSIAEKDLPKELQNLPEE